MVADYISKFGYNNSSHFKCSLFFETLTFLCEAVESMCYLSKLDRPL